MNLLPHSWWYCGWHHHTDLENCLAPPRPAGGPAPVSAELGRIGGQGGGQKRLLGSHGASTSDPLHRQAESLP